MAKERDDRARIVESLIAAGKMIVEINCNDAALVKRLLSNPILDKTKPKWLHLKLPGEPVQMWLMIEKAWER